ncbi:thioredoxin domain-containing protein 17-like [Bolinopsis microptera]|uniref:thioredoxin domain-containing protein 17-like n=1 Tax=Bolinopsis microptera TaxID=2820187 RepID=UPI003079EFD7
MANVVKHVKVSGFTEYLRAVQQYKDSSLHLLTLFTGSVDSEGKSWCPDCNVADPVIEEALNSAPECTCIITVQIDRTTWKDRNNSFRKSEDLKLTSVPTLIKVGTDKRLVESQCAKLSLVQMLLEDD